MEPNTNPEPTPPEKPEEPAAPVSETPAVPEPGVSTPEAVPAAVQAPQAPEGPQGVVAGGPVPSGNNGGGSKGKRMKIALIAAAGVVVLLAGSAAAYFGAIVPNKPENVLKAAVANTLQQKQASFKGEFTLDSTDGSTPSFKATMSGAEDFVAKATDINVNLTVSGVTVPVEARIVNKNLYFKVGDLSQAVKLLTATSPDLGELGQAVAGKLSNQWIVVDSTLLDQAGVSCALDTSLAFTDDDIKYIQTQYNANQFATIKSSSIDTVNGQAAIKYELAINDDKAAAFGKKLDQLSVVKALQKCNTTKDATTDTESLADGDTTPLTLWVDKSSKRISKISLHSTSQDAKKDNLSGTFETTFTYGPVSIKAPSDAKPFTDVLADLETTLGGSDATTNALLGGGF